MQERQPTSIGVIGGTGNLGAALAIRLAKAGHTVMIGSRDAERAQTVAQELSANLPQAINGASNDQVAEQADLIIVSVPFASQQSTLSALADKLKNKIVVDTCVPLMPPKVMRVQLPAEGCAALRAQALLDESTRVVSAFHNVAAHKLATDEQVECDVLVFGDDKDARATVVSLANDIGLRGLHGGSLANSAAAEALTSILIFMNKTYKVDGAGIRITGHFDLSALG
ncbi:prephenate dehydrogenase [compost metagenome]